MRTCLAIAVCMLVLSVGARAEDVPPALLVKTGETSEPLAVESVKTDVMIHGFLAETKMTITFRNPHNRVLAGDLYFPLPEGSTVAGYALDINGKMVPGVVVTKEKARVVFEKEMRKGVDPGIVEWTKGNTFKTRVFPIPANGTRTVRVRYVSEIDTAEGSPRYVLPLNFKEKIKAFALDVRVMKALPKTAGMFAERGDFEQEEEGVQEFHWQEADATADEDFVVMLQYIEDDLVMVETDEDGRTWFCLMDPVQIHAGRVETILPQRITILWDASASRGAGGHARELALLKRYLDSVLPDPGRGDGGADGLPVPVLTVDVVLFRNAPETAKTFACPAGGKGLDELLQFLKDVQYDGGSTLSAIQPAKDARASDFYLLFTDGLHTFGREKEVVFPAPVYAFSEDASTDPAALQALCARSGGHYVNLRTANEDDAIAVIGAPVNAISRIGAKSGKLSSLCPAPGQPVTNRLIICGRLESQSADLDVRLSMDGENSLAYRIDSAHSVNGDLLRTYWAQRKLQHLLLDKAANADALVAHGKEHRIVTPGTSLIVLETLDQYVEHEILPPRALPEMRAEYARLMEQRGAQEKQETENKIQRVLAMWNERVQWWNQEFKVAKDFKYDGPAADTEDIEETSAQEVGIVEAGEGRALGGRAARVVTRSEQNAEEPADAAGGEDSAPSTVVNAELPQANIVTTDVEITDHLETAEEEKDMALGDPDSISDVDEGSALMGVGAAGGSGGGGRFGYMVRRDIEAVPSEERERESLDALRADGHVTVGGNARVAHQAAAQAVHGDVPPSNAADPGVALHGWKPDAPYLKKIKEAGEGKRLSAYLAERKGHGEAPSFYLEAADLFLEARDRASAIRVLSNIAELELENAALLRVLAHRLAQIGELDLAAATFEEVKRMRPEEPQSYRDLALVYEQLGRAEEAAKLLYHVVMHHWDRFDQIEIIALMELNRLGAKHNLDLPALGVDSRLVKNMPVDLRIVMTWDADMTDIDLWVTEPTKETCLYSHNRTAIGGALSRDFTQGYGPEEYVLKTARPGVYEIRAHYYGSQSVTLTGSVTVQATVYTNYGRPNEKRQSMTLRLRQKEDKYLIGKIEF